MNDHLTFRCAIMLLCWCVAISATAAESVATPDPATHAEASAEADATTASITVASLRQGQLIRPLTMYGTVVPATGSTQVITMACDVVIDQWLIPAGAALPAKAVLGRAHITPEAAAARNEAVVAEVAAHDDLRLVRARHDLKLATQQEVLQAVNAAQIAEVRASAWKTRCRDEQVEFVTPVVGFLLAVNVSAGQTISAGTPIATVTTGAQEARLGLEPGDAQALGPNAQFRVSVSQQPDRHFSPASAAMISAIVDPDTRLLTVLVPLNQELKQEPREMALVPFGSAISAQVDRQGPTGLLVPRAALVRENDGWCVFVIAADVAHHRAVTLLAESGSEAAISAADLHAEELVAVTGSGVLVEGMRVNHDAETPAKSGDKQ